MLYNRVREHSQIFSKRNRVFYNRFFMHINARDRSPPLNFCFIIDTPRIFYWCQVHDIIYIRVFNLFLTNLEWELVLKTDCFNKGWKRNYYIMTSRDVKTVVTIDFLGSKYLRSILQKLPRGNHPYYCWSSWNPVSLFMHQIFFVS